jgi:mannobiose 2-epimerase
LLSLVLPAVRAADPTSKPARPAIYDETADGVRQIATALAQARSENKHVLLMFGANWCGWCHRLHKLFESDAAIAAELQRGYELVLIDVNKGHNAAVDQRYGKPTQFGLPVLVVLDASGKALKTQDTGKLEEGDHHDPAKVLAFLKEWGPRFSAAVLSFKKELTDKVLPYWYDAAIDRARGGYVLADDASGTARPATEKQIVTQSRMVWGFAHVYRKGYRDPKRDYLEAARHGYRFLLDKFRDPEHGGYYWKTDLDGRPVNDRKYLYGEAFVVYALVEYYRASGDAEALRHARDLFQTLQRRCHDPRHEGWGEHFERDWRLITQQDGRIEVEVAGLKSANAHLHWMEALAELYDATQDGVVRQALVEALRLNATWFYPPDPGRSCFHRNPDGSVVTDPKSAGLSYGHNVEFAWLMIRAEEVLGQPPSWAHFDAILGHALQYGYDHARGGLYNRGADDQPATDTDKVWWSQSEMMAALTDGLRHQPNAAYTAALDSLIRFLRSYQIRTADGIWLESLAADGTPKSTAKAHNWKANYHDVRALVKFIDAFGER